MRSTITLILLLSLPTVGAAEIHKWCTPDKQLTRYTTSEQQPEGFEPCGELKTKVVCDAEGRKRIINRNEEPPHGFLPCTDQPRIFIQKTIDPKEQPKAFDEFWKEDESDLGYTYEPAERKSAKERYFEELDALLDK